MLKFGSCRGIILGKSKKLRTLKEEIFRNSCIDLPQDNFNGIYNSEILQTFNAECSSGKGFFTPLETLHELRVHKGSGAKLKHGSYKREALRD